MIIADRMRTLIAVSHAHTMYTLHSVRYMQFILCILCRVLNVEWFEQSLAWLDFHWDFPHAPFVDGGAFAISNVKCDSQIGGPEKP